MKNVRRVPLYAPLLAVLLTVCNPPHASAQTPDSGIAAPAVVQPPVAAATEASAAAASEASSRPEPSRSFWGWGLGYVFTDVPISQSEFTVFMSQLYYSYYLSPPQDNMRTALSLGVYGFAFILPVPKVSAEFYLGRPNQDIQGKLGVGGFYDVAVGGHAGVSGELGIRIKNKVDVSFLVVPTGIDSERDYLDFMGLRKEGDKVSPPYVIFPYFGIFVGFHY